MPEVYVSAERAMAAPAGQVYTCIADFQRHHAHFLPPAFSDFKVEEGGVGAGTIISFRLKAGPRERSCRSKVAEPEPGRMLIESDLNSSMVTTFTVTPKGDGCSVQIETRWKGASGIGGFMERLFAPRFLKELYADELKRLEEYASSQAASG